MSTSPPNFHLIDSPPTLQSILSADLTTLSVLYFRASWAEPCRHMDLVILDLARKYTSVNFLQIEAEAQPEIAESFDVAAVPHTVVLRGHQLLATIEGSRATDLFKAIEVNVGGVNGTGTGAGTAGKVQPLSRTDQRPEAPPATYEKKVEGTLANGAKGAGIDDMEEDEKDESEEETVKRCKDIMASAPIVLFMKGDPTTPRCGFSRKTVDLLNAQSVTFTSFDILEDEAVRQTLKKVNDWPTFPQLVVNGEFVGGLDILKEMVENGEFEETVGKVGRANGNGTVAA